MKRDMVLSFIELNGGATVDEIAEKFESSKSSVRQTISYLRDDGNEIKTIRSGNIPCSYHLIRKADKKETNHKIDDIRVILATGDAWECKEIAEMIGKSTKFVSNTIGWLRRNHKVPIKTIRTGHHDFSYQMEIA